MADVQIAAGITDARTFAKKDVKSVTKPAEDEKFYQGIKAYKISANSYTQAEYDALVRALDAFIAKFPKSAHLKEIQANLEAIRAEKKRVDEGQLKLLDRWYSAEEAVREKYQIDAQRAFLGVRALAARGDIIGALNAFDNLEKNWPGSAVYPDAAEFAMTLVTRLDTEIDRLTAAAKQDEALFQAKIVLVSEPQKSQTIAARKARITAAEAAVENADRLSVKWKPLYATTEKSTGALKTVISTELQRLSTMGANAMRTSIAKSDIAAAALKAGDLATAESALREAQAAWYANERLLRLNNEIQTLKMKPKPTPTPAATGTAGGAPGTRRSKAN